MMKHHEKWGLMIKQKGDLTINNGDLTSNGKIHLF
jgi:hypothetical protein